MSIMNNYVVYSENTGLTNRSFLERSKVVNRKVEFQIRLKKLSDGGNGKQHTYRHVRAPTHTHTRTILEKQSQGSLRR